MDKVLWNINSAWHDENCLACSTKSMKSCRKHEGYWIMHPRGKSNKVESMGSKVSRCYFLKVKKRIDNIFLAFGRARSNLIQTLFENKHKVKIIIFRELTYGRLFRLSKNKRHDESGRGRRRGRLNLEFA